MLIYTMLHFFKKIKKNTCRYHYQNLDDIIYSFWDIEQNIPKLVILGYFLPFYPLKTPKINFEKSKTLLEISSSYICVPKITIIWCMVPETWSMTDRIFCHSGLFFALLLPYGPRKSIFFKNEKNNWRYCHFTKVYHKWQSYDVWFLKYRVQWTEFFVIFDHFWPFYSLTTQKIKILKKWKKRVEIISFYYW